MEIYNNPNPINISPEDTKNCLVLIQKLISSLQFFGERLTNQPTYNDVHTHMGLFESYFSELCEHVPYNSVLKDERESRYKALKEANLRIQQLQKSAANQINGESVQAKLSQYNEIFTCIYEAIGIHYCSLKEITRWGFIYETSDELSYESYHHLSSIRLENMPEHILTTHPNLEITRDTYHGNILDTDNNKAILTEVFKTWFPNMRIHKFSSRQDCNQFKMRITLSVPFSDFDPFVKTIISKNEK